MHRLVVIAVAVLAVVLSGCGITTTLPTTPTVPTTPATAAPAAHLRVIPYTTPLTVTGTYPRVCRAPTVAGKPRPDRTCTPGSIGDRVTQDTIAVTICAPNWTDTIRPASSITERVKTAAIRAYGLGYVDRKTIELDHAVPLGLGGADDVTNLWPQRSDLPGSGFANTKDSVERVLVKAVCTRRVPLGAAQDAIAADWTTARAALGV